MFLRGSRCTTVLELDPQNHTKDGLKVIWDPTP